MNVVVEVDDLDRLQLERCLVDNAGETVACPDIRKELRVAAAGW
jgi:hypothetical protein